MHIFHLISCQLLCSGYCKIYIKYNFLCRPHISVTHKCTCTMYISKSIDQLVRNGGSDIGVVSGGKNGCSALTYPRTICVSFTFCMLYTMCCCYYYYYYYRCGFTLCSD